MGTAPQLPPLRVWLYGLFFAAAVLALLMPLRQLVEKKTGETLAVDVQQFLSAPRAQGDVRVLGLGSSLLRAATPAANYQHLQGPRWRRLTKSYVGLGHLDVVLQSIVQQPPDVLVIDTNLLLPSDTLMEDLRDTLADAPKNAVYAVMARMGRGAPWSEQVLQQQDAPFRCVAVAPERLQQQRAILVPLQQAELSRAAVDTVLAGKLSRLSQKGVRIVFLDLRRSQQFEQDLLVEKQRWLQRWQRVLPPGPTIRYLSSPDFHQPDLYCDGRHLSSAGALRFAPWWRYQLEQMSKDH